MENVVENIEALCKYCKYPENEEDDLLRCKICNIFLHIRCTKRGSVPGGILGDVFFTFICGDCTGDKVEEFTKERVPWFHTIYLVLYNYTKRSPGISRQGFYHWKLHVAAFIDQHWDILLGKDTKRRKMWIGTISGSLSIYSNFLFTSGTSTLNEAGWWALRFPNLKPRYLLRYAKLIADIKQNKVETTFEDALSSDNVSEFYLKTIDLEKIEETESLVLTDANEQSTSSDPTDVITKTSFITGGKKRKNLLPTIENIRNNIGLKSSKGARSNTYGSTTLDPDFGQTKRENESKPVILKDPMCHYNTSLNSISRIEGLRLAQKLLGNMMEDSILSPYSGLYMKPYIRRDSESKPLWLSLMTEMQLVSNYRSNKEYQVPPRYTIDYAYVQPGHIPAINSLCNHFFWPGIDLTDCLQYPEFSCVALYRRLIVGFAFVVPDVGVNEGYVSFMFVRPGWRNAGIARFMLYHLIQICSGKDLTLHVSINNPALFLYQKFGFKVEKVVLDFYDKYIRRDSFESKHAFFCRLER